MWALKYGGGGGAGGRSGHTYKAKECECSHTWGGGTTAPSWAASAHMDQRGGGRAVCSPTPLWTPTPLSFVQLVVLLVAICQHFKMLENVYPFPDNVPTPTPATLVDIPSV